MDSSREEQLHALSTIRCEHQLMEAITALAHDLGFDLCAYGLRMPVPVSQPRVAMFNNFPASWQARYREQDYVNVDPTVRHGTRSLLPIVWSDEVFASAQDLWEEARSYGLRVGWAQSSRDVNGTAGLLTLARAGEPLSDSELRAKSLTMSWLAHAAHSGMSRCLTAKLLPESEIRLTEREAAVLRWTGDGKTSSEISEIMRISESTVNFHVRNAVAKLGAANKLAATVKAAMLGMLY